MQHEVPHMHPALTRRRFLHATLSSAAGLTAWHQGCPRSAALAQQKNTPSGQMTWALHVTVAPS